MKTIYEVRLGSQYHEGMTCFCDGSDRSVIEFLESQGIVDTEANYFLFAFQMAKNKGVSTYRSETDKYTVEVTERTLWLEA